MLRCDLWERRPSQEPSRRRAAVAAWLGRILHVVLLSDSAWPQEAVNRGAEEILACWQWEACIRFGFLFSI